MAEKHSKGVSLSTQCKNTLTSRARLCPLLKHGSVMAFRPNTLIPFMALLSVNKCENCHCLFFPRFGQKIELSWRVGRYLGQDQLYFLSLFSHRLHKTPQHWAAAVPIHLHQTTCWPFSRDPAWLCANKTPHYAYQSVMLPPCQLYIILTCPYNANNFLFKAWHFC